MREKIAEGITMYLGDCRELIPSLKDIQCVVTSAPYNQLSTVKVANTGTFSKSKQGGGFAKKWEDTGYEDNLEDDVYIKQQNKVFSLLAKVCLDTASLFYNHQLQWRNKVLQHPIEWFKPKDWIIRQELVWNRLLAMPLDNGRFLKCDERILWFTKTQKPLWKKQQYTSVWNIPPAQRKDHPVAFPLELPLRCIRCTTNKGDIVLDPYAGSATTGVAAIYTGRKFVGIEKEKRFFEMACENLERALKKPMFFVDKPVLLKERSFFPTKKGKGND